MKLVVDNPMQVPAKRAGKSHKTFPHLLAKMTGGDGMKINAMADFSRILEARIPTADKAIEKNTSNSRELEEQSSIELLDKNYLDTTPFGNLFEDMERKYEQDLKETASFEFHQPDDRLVQDVKLIDARALFGSLRLERQGFDPAHPDKVETLAAALPRSGESDSPKERNNIGTDMQLWSAPGKPQAEIVTPLEFSRTEKQQPVTGLSERAESGDVSSLEKTTVTRGKTAETNFASDMSVQRLEASPALAATPSPMQQVVERVTKMLPAQSLEIRNLPDGQKTVRFALQPENLGDVSIILRLRDSGIDLAIRPQRQETAQYFENSRDELLLSMKLSGVELGNVEIKSLDLATSQDARQDKPTAGQGGSHTSQFQSPHGGNPFHGGNKENQWRAPDVAEVRKGVMDETEQAQGDSPAVGRGIVL